MVHTGTQMNPENFIKKLEVQTEVFGGQIPAKHCSTKARGNFAIDFSQQKWYYTYTISIQVIHDLVLN